MRPVLIDERDGACEICVIHVNGHCDDCQAEIPEYKNMGGNGYQSVRPTHYHMRAILGIDGREAKYSELCLDCYRINWELVYPESPCQV